MSTVIDDNFNEENILLNRTIAHRKAKHFPYSWWKQAIYVELVDSNDNENNSKVVKISYYNTDSDLELSADTLLIKSCVFYLNKDSAVISNNENVHILNITLDFENGEKKHNESQILKFESYHEANNWITQINKELELISSINVECKICKNMSNNKSEICNNCLESYAIV